MLLNSVLRPVLRPVMSGVMDVVGVSRWTPSRLFDAGEQGVSIPKIVMADCYTDTARTTPVSAIGDAVASVVDRSGRGNHPIQATLANRPKFGRRPATGRRNLIRSSAVFVTQTARTEAQAYTISFKGTGTITLSGTSTAGPLVGTGAADRVSLTFTPTSGTLTMTVSGAVTECQFEAGSSVTAIQTAAEYWDVTEPLVNSVYLLWFDGANDELTVTVDLSASQQLTIFALASYDSITGNKGLFQVGPAAAFAYGYVIGSGLSQKLVGTAGTSNKWLDPTVYPITPTRPVLFTYGYDLGGATPALCQSLRKNSVFPAATDSGPAAGGGSYGTNAIKIGSTSGLMFQGGIESIIIRGGATDDATKYLAENYCSAASALKRVAVVGDSVTAGYLGTTPTGEYLHQTLTTTLSVPGHTVAQQKTVWLALTDAERAAFRCVLLQIGLNDLPSATTTAATIAAVQDLVTTISASCPTILISQMTPVKQRMIDLYGAVAGATAYQKWLDVNTAIAGGGASPITGVSARITSHVALLNDGAGNLAAAYDTGDHVHPNNAGRQVNAAAWQSALVAAGLVL